jgi:flagellar hook-associated protein 1
MTLFSTLQVANNSLVASQLGLQVTGNNIANANTPGYVRERIVVGPAPTVRYGGLLLGTGVAVEAIVQQTDRFLEERMRAATSDLANGEAQEGAYVKLESLLGELTDTDLSSSLTNFFNSIQDILNQPESVSVRNLAILQGRTLTDDIRRLDDNARQLREDLNNQVVDSTSKINSLLEEIAKLNIQIVTAEGGEIVKSDAVGLRDRRSNVLKDLAELVNIRTAEQQNGDVTVFVGGDYLVFQGTYREVKSASTFDRGQPIAELRLKETDSPLAITSGKIAGLYTARDTALTSFLDGLDSFAKTLAFEFNKVYSSGQGLTGFSSVLSEFAVVDTAAPIDQAGLMFSPVNGSFEVQVLNKQTGITTTKVIKVDLNGLEGETSLDSLAAALNDVDGIRASVTPARQLLIEADTPLLSFSFANDTSGALAALGVNTFFSGTGASDIGINAVVQSDPTKFAASKTGIGEDSKNAELLSNLLSTPLGTQANKSLANLYDALTGELAQGSAVSKAVAEGFRVFQRTLEGQYMAISGVNIDEEAVKLIAYQRAFQASARVISTISDLLDVLVRL